MTRSSTGFRISNDDPNLEDRIVALEERLAAFEKVGPDYSWPEHIEFAPGAEVVFGGQRFRLVDEDAA